MKLLLVLLLAASLRADSHGVVLKRVDGETAGRNVYMRPYVAPLLEFAVEAGDVPQGVPLTCKQGVQVNKRQDHADKILVLQCESGIKLRLIGVELGQ